MIEVKTRIVDLGAIERQFGWYERSAPQLARDWGWRVDRVAGWLIALASDEVDATIRANVDVMRAAFPMRADDMSLVINGPTVTIDRGRGVALIDPSSRRRDWLLKTRSDGRRTTAPYRDYADAARRFRS